MDAKTTLDFVDGSDVYVSDVHGEYKMFSRILECAGSHDCRLHLVGDVYDRGPAPDKVMDALAGYPAVDVQWGNHDIVWMGAALGQPGCIAHVVRNCARYGNLDILEAYGIDLEPLFAFAADAYKDDPCAAFSLKSDPGLSPADLERCVKVQKAMAILQFKVEAALIDEYPSFGLDDRKLLGAIDWDAKTAEVDGVVWPLADTLFPTVDKNDPYALTTGEAEAMDALAQEFRASRRLQEHISFLLDAGALYKIIGNTLALHACVPLDQQGGLLETDVYGTPCRGKALYDAMQDWVYKAFRSADDSERRLGADMLWYMWLGAGSPLFAKSKMATFEIYLITDKAARKEEKNAFYKLGDRPDVYDAIFEDFGMDPDCSRIVCGHVPVKVKDGEDPVRADGKVICIDGGMSPAYQKTTGIAGFVLEDTGGELVLSALDALDADSALDAASVRCSQRRIS